LRRRVAVLAAAGMPHWGIATSLGISKPTLEKHFEYELSVGASKKRADLLDRLHRLAMEGSVSAISKLLAMNPEFSPPPADADAMPADSAQPGADPAQPAAPPVQPVTPLAEGKKAQAQVAAKTAAVGTEWEDLLKPGTPLQ
jgi:hypothetical protein